MELLPRQTGKIAALLDRRGQSAARSRPVVSKYSKQSIAFDEVRKFAPEFLAQRRRLS
jgi:hypothetical protein